MKALVTIVLSCALCTMSGFAQTITLDLTGSIAIAIDSSLQAFRVENQYMADYWAFRTYKAGRLPLLTLQSTPLEYRRDFTRRYDSNTNIDIFRQQQSLYSYGNLSFSQNIDITGGTLFLDTELGYMRNFGDNSYTQYSSVPLRIGYSQSLFGFNTFKWEKRIEPLKYMKAKTSYLYAREEISETTIQYFFTLALARVEHNMATANVASSDTLYRIGQERQKIASISQSDLLTLKLDAVNARNTLKNAEISLKRAMFNFASYLHLNKDIQIALLLPDHPGEIHIDPEMVLALARTNNPDFLSNQQELWEAEREVDRTRKSSNFDASFSASVGFNQVSDNFRGAYRNPLQQDVIRIGLTVPIVDWGVRRGRANMARNTLNVTRISIQQREDALEQDLIMTANDFNIQQDLISSAEEALELALMAYESTKERFIIGKTDLNSLTLSLDRQNAARRNYLAALRDYWLNYYKLRKLTLFDFERQESLSQEFDMEN